MEMPNEKESSALQSYRDLDAWQHAMDLVQLTYELTSTLPTDERFGLTSQMRRAAVSIPSNIAEGYGRRHRGDYIHHLSIANGSLKELETQFILLSRLNYASKEQLHPIWQKAQETGRIMFRLIQALEATK